MRRESANRTAKGYHRAYYEAHRDQKVAQVLACQARRKEYLETMFAETPERRHQAEASRVVVLSDLQIPFEDPAAVNQALDVIARVQPDLVVLNGDIVDCYAESAFLKNVELAEASIPETHRRVRVLLDALRPVPRKVWLGGNHEDRWRKLMWAENLTSTGKRFLTLHQNAAGLDGIDLRADAHVESFRRLFHLDEYGIAYHPWYHRLYLADGNLVVTHGKYVHRHAGQTAKRTLEWLGKSCIVGHTHRLGMHLVTQDGTMHGAWENGCLCHLEPEYDDAPNWQQGFSVVRIEGPEFHVISVPIVRREGVPVAVYGGD